MVYLVRRTARRISTYWRVLTRRDRVTSSMEEEMRFHVEAEADRLVKEHGLPVEEARRRALVSFGGVEKYKEAGHDVHGLRWLDALLLDARFSLRMLLKHRGLTLAGAFAMAVAIAVGATTFEVIADVLDSPLPLPGGDRIVAIDFIGTDPGSPEQKVIHEFAALRGPLTTIEHLSGYKNAQHNLVAQRPHPNPWPWRRSPHPRLRSPTHHRCSAVICCPPTRRRLPHPCSSSATRRGSVTSPATATLSAER